MKKTLLTALFLFLILFSSTSAFSEQIIKGGEIFLLFGEQGTAYVTTTSSTTVRFVQNKGELMLGENTYTDYGYFIISIEDRNTGRTLDRYEINSVNSYSFTLPSNGNYKIIVQQDLSGKIKSDHPFIGTILLFYESKWISFPQWYLYFDDTCEISSGGRTEVIKQKKDTEQSQQSQQSQQSIYYPNGQITVNHYKDGVLFDSENVTISYSQPINSKSMWGYDSSPLSTWVSFDSSTGVCSPSVINFYYSKISFPTEAPSSQNRVISTGSIVYPYDWDTQFKPGTATTVVEGKVDNENKYIRLPNLYDNNASTSFWWLIWKSEREDYIPEISALFNNATVSSVGIRNGNASSQSEYYKYARVRRFRVQIQYSGGVSETYITLGDNYSKDYQKCSLGRTYSGVTRIDFFLDGGANEGFYTGNSETYYIHIADMQFYD